MPWELMREETFMHLEKENKPSLLASVMIAILSTCAQLERDNITFRLNSERKQYVEKGGKLGRPTGSTKSQDKKREEYREVINLLNKGYASVMLQNSQEKESALFKESRRNLWLDARNLGMEP
jgi:DNA invertase Pin-like site-specific DNA recombinase